LKEHGGLLDEDVTLFPDNNHFLAEEVPDAVAEGVLSFLGS